MAWVLDLENLQPAEKLLLLGIANHADKSGDNAWPSVSTLARYVGVSSRRIQQLLRVLETKGLVVTVLNDGGDRRVPVDRRPNRYRVLMDGVKWASPAGRTVLHPAPEAGFTSGVKWASPKPSLEPPMNHSSSIGDVTAFELFWKVYPRKVGKVEARRVFDKLMTRRDAPSVDVLLASVGALVKEGREERFIPHAATWLRQERFMDELPSVVPAPVDVVAVAPVYCGECENGWTRIVDAKGVEWVQKCGCVYAGQKVI